MSCTHQSSGSVAGDGVSWESFRHDHNSRAFRIGIWLSVATLTLFSLVDTGWAPVSQWHQVLWTRAALVTLSVVCLLSCSTHWLRRHLDQATAVYTLLVGATLVISIVLTGGFESHYYAGLSLVMMVAGLLMLWPLRLSIVVHGLLVVMYVLSNAIGVPADAWGAAISGTTFLIATAILVVIGQAFHYGTRYEAWQSHEQITELNRQLVLQSRHDALTSVANRRALDEVLIREFGRARRERAPLSLIVCDIDHFKEFNDAHGHLRGDHCLKIVADQLRQIARRPGDFVGRWGGDEFLVVLPRTDASGAQHVAERIRHAVGSRSDAMFGTVAASPITVSLGCATLGPATESCDALLQAADAALYDAKKLGRNCVAAHAAT